ncbi:MAG: nucleoside monophosphate kinase [Clostridia bacterium]|nr:nucleoside monophosphate kinase [Clostridia bacterium]
MKIVLLGAPGSGKGTLAQQISKDFALPQISTGDILRAEIKKGSACGKVANDLLSKGEIVPDDLIIKLLKQRIKDDDCKNGYILDGFPRTLQQAKELSKITQIDFVFFLETPVDTIISRLETRRICEKCGRVHNLKLSSAEICENCGGKLIQRDDDKPEIIQKRFEVFEKNILPLKEYYKPVMIYVKSKDLIEETYIPVKKVLEKKVEK